MQMNASMLQILEMRFKLSVLERLLCTIVNTTTILHTAPGDCEEALLATVIEWRCAKMWKTVSGRCPSSRWTITSRCSFPYPAEVA